MNERKPRRPSDGIQRAPRTGDSSGRSRAGDGPRQPRQGGTTGGRKGGTTGGRKGGTTGGRKGGTTGARASGGRGRTGGSRVGDDRAQTGRGRRGEEDRRRRTPRADEDKTRRPRPQKRTVRRGDSSARGAGGRNKRTSRNSDDRNPTRSGIDYPSPKYRPKHAGAEVAGTQERPALRKVRRPTDRAPAPERDRRTRKPKPKPGSASPRRRRGGRTEAGDELSRLAGRGAKQAQADLARAAEAFTAGRERDAARILRPLRDLYPDAGAVRELLGLSQYRLGQYAAASKELEAFAEITGSVEQHPVLMDCARALGRDARVEELWEELAAASPSAALVSEGRIVLAGSRADQGHLDEAIATLDRRRGIPARVQEHHVRVWYALADLYERAGEIPKARELFLRVRRYDAAFADVAERLAALN